MLRGSAKFRIQSEIGAAVSTLTAGVRRNLASNCCCAFFKGNCFPEPGSEVSATRFSRIEPGQVGWNWRFLKKRIKSIFVYEKTPNLSHLSVLNPGGEGAHLWLCVLSFSSGWV